MYTAVRWRQTLYINLLAAEPTYLFKQDILEVYLLLYNMAIFLIVSAAKMQDGVSHWYLPEQTLVEADKELVEAACRYCEQKGYSYIKDMWSVWVPCFIETHDMVKEWSLADFLGVDMETVTTLAIAHKFNKRAVGLLNLSDLLLHGDTVYSYTKDRELIESETDKAIRDVALYLSSKF